MTPLAALAAAGEALHGPRWRSPLARQLQRPGAPKQGIELRHLHRWLREERPTPAWLLPALVSLLRAEGARRAADLEQLADRIQAAS